MPELTLGELAGAYAGDPEQPDKDEFGNPIYVVPKIWTAAHVNHRLAEGLAVIRRVVARPGPRAIKTGWPAAMLAELSGLDDGYRPSREEVERGLRRSAERPGAAAIAFAEEAVYWPVQFLTEGDPRTDALKLWLLGQTEGVNIERVLSRRRLLADEMIRLLKGKPEKPEVDIDAVKAAARGVAATANVQLAEARERARAARSERQLAAARADAQWVRKRAKERLANIIDRERLIRRPAAETIDRAEVMPGKVFWRQTLDKMRLDGAAQIATGLRLARVPVR